VSSRQYRRPLSAALVSFVFWRNQRLGEKAQFEIFYRCKSHLDYVDMVIALLDGSQVDDGTAWEIGYFHARKSPEQKILGIRTDFRWAGLG
jgi:nucleoside 2-deoxyribosyltransferase